MIDGVLVIDKPVGPTSFDVVRSIKKIFKGAKVGHAGSLDPFATGVLIVLLGVATKLSDKLLHSDKSYVAELSMGTATDSLDGTGNVVRTEAVPEMTLESIDSVVQSFAGEWMQLPPMYSAKKIDGVRLYRLARKNIEVERERTAVQLFELVSLGYSDTRLTFSVRCSKGTYVRSLAAEIAERLQTVGHLSQLRRLSVGKFSVSDALTLEAIEANASQALEVAAINYRAAVNNVAPSDIEVWSSPKCFQNNEQIGNSLPS